MYNTQSNSMLPHLLPSPYFETAVAILVSPSTGCECALAKRKRLLVGARVGGFVLSLGMAGNRPGFRIRRDSKSFNSMRENEQRKPSVYPHEASTEQFEMRGNNAREKVRGKRKSKKNWISPRLNLLCPTFQPPMP